ncbi:MAG: GNAT family N-acetyltransferase [Butyricicoccus sp.]|nr:GNAT family N-acetyltransferase [Butyricicoccus sp.]
MSRLHIRTAKADDAAALLEIYTPYVTDTAISFEYETPSVEEFRGRLIKTLKKYPYLVAELDGRIAGYAYTGPFVGRAAYSWDAETTIYLERTAQRIGCGRELYEALAKVSLAQNIYSLNACIGWRAEDDGYLGPNSANFHAHVGFELTGRFRGCGYKFGRWYDMIWMTKQLSPRPDAAPKVVPFPELSAETVRECGIDV